MVFPSSKRYININCGPCKASEPVNRSKQQFDRLEEIIADFANKHEASLNEAAILKDFIAQFLKFLYIYLDYT